LKLRIRDWISGVKFLNVVFFGLIFLSLAIFLDLSFRHENESEFDQRPFNAKNLGVPAEILSDHKSPDEESILNMNVPAGSRAEMIKLALEKAEQIDLDVWIDKIYSYCSGNQRAKALESLIVELQKGKGVLDPVGLLTKINAGADRKLVIERITRLLNEEQINALAVWISENAFPDEKYECVSGLVAGRISSLTAQKLIMEMDQSYGDQSALFARAARAAGKQGRSAEWIVELTNGLDDNVVSTTFTAYLHERFPDSPARLAELKKGILPPPVTEHVAYAIGSQQGVQQSGPEGYQLAQTSADPTSKAYLRGVVSGWASRDLEDVSRFLASADPSPFRDRAIESLVKHLTSIGHHEDAQAWTRALGKGAD
jgi:hypothetical protein